MQYFKRLPFVLIALLLAASLLPAAGTASAQQGLDWDIPNGHFFTQANGAGGAGGTGFAVTNEGGINFWSEFQRLGGVEAIGYPISTRFTWNGFTVQAFQKVVLQWRPEVGQAYFVNVIDELHNQGYDEQLSAFKSTPAVANWSSDSGLAWPAVVQRHQALLDANPAIKAKYFSVADPELLYGLPMAPVLDLGSVEVLRAQRVIIQHWKVATPWSNPGDVLIANGGDVAKDLGLFDASVLVPQAAPRGGATPLTPLPPTNTGLPRYGVIANPGVPAEMTRVRQAGASLTVLAVVWREIEPNPTSPDQFNWAATDRLFENARQAGLTPLVIVTGNPTWAWASGPNGIIRPDALGEFAEFVGAAVARYRDYTPYWSFYNEPDCNGPVTPEIHASCWGNHGAAYAQMLKTVYPAVKQANPNALVVFGGMAFDNFQPDRAFARGFLEATLAAGAASAFDVFNFHYYTGFRSTWEPYGTDVIGKTTYLRGILNQYGVNKPIILTEIGTGSQGPGESAELQARYVAQAYARSLAAGIDTVFWYDAADAGPYGFGLLTGNLEPKQSFYAYQTMSRVLGDRPFQRALGPNDLGTNGVEGYEFGGNDGRRVLVLWSTSDATHTVSIAGNSGRIIGLTGTSAAAAGGNGTVQAPVGPRPVYLEVG